MEARGETARLEQRRGVDMEVPIKWHFFCFTLLVRLAGPCRIPLARLFEDYHNPAFMVYKSLNLLCGKCKKTENLA